MKIYMLSGRAKAGKDTAKDILVEHLKQKNADYGYYAGAAAQGGAAYLAEKVRVRAFAEPLKKMVCILLGLTEEQMNDPEVKETARPWLVNLGGDVRERDPNAWADNAARTVQAWVGEKVEHVFITDWRYFNEAYRIIEVFHRMFNPHPWIEGFVKGRIEVHLLRVSADREVRAARMGDENYRRYVERGIAKDSSESQLDTLETSDFKVNPGQLEDVKTLRASVRVVHNNGTRESFAADVIQWFELINSKPWENVYTVDPPHVMKACYRLARNMGPEARLMVMDEEYNASKSLEIA